MRILGFLLFLFTVSLLLHAYLWWRLSASHSRSRRVKLWTAAAAALFAALPPTAMWASHYDAGASVWTRILSWVGFIELGVAFYLLVVLLLMEPLRLLGRWVLRHIRKRDEKQMQERDREVSPDEVSPEEQELSRRLMLSRTLAVSAGVVAAGAVSYGAWQAIGRPVVEHMPITLKKLDASLHGMRIGVVSDIHLGAFTRRPRLQDIVHTLNRLDLSAVCIVGDLVDGDVDQLGSVAEPLAELETEHGVYFVTGNHEYYSGSEEWIEFLPTLGVRVLQNQRRELQIGGAGIDIAGINDVQAHEVEGLPGPDLEAALTGRDTQRPVLLMAHQPVLFEDAAKRGVDLQVSGHTHGGQMWPFGYAVRLEQPVVEGYARHGASQLYVTRGAGFWGPPVRVGAPPEITVLELESPKIQ